MNTTNSFLNDWRKQQELKGRTYADYLYINKLNAESIRRFDDINTEEHLLDRIYGIDVELTLNTGMVLTIQEKFLSHSYSKYNSLTIEYMQNHMINERGDWFRIDADLYLIAYLNEKESQFEKWAFIDIPMLKIATSKNKVTWTDNINKHDNARASFKWTDVKDMHERCIYMQFGFSTAQNTLKSTE